MTVPVCYIFDALPSLSRDAPPLGDALFMFVVARRDIYYVIFNVCSRRRPVYRFSRPAMLRLIHISPAIRVLATQFITSHVLYCRFIGRS